MNVAVVCGLMKTPSPSIDRGTSAQAQRVQAIEACRAVSKRLDYYGPILVHLERQDIVTLRRKYAEQGTGVSLEKRLVEFISDKKTDDLDSLKATYLLEAQTSYLKGGELKFYQKALFNAYKKVAFSEDLRLVEEQRAVIKRLLYKEPETGIQALLALGRRSYVPMEVIQMLVEIEDERALSLAFEVCERELQDPEVNPTCGLKWAEILIESEDEQQRALAEKTLRQIGDDPRRIWGVWVQAREVLRATGYDAPEPKVEQELPPQYFMGPYWFSRPYDPYP